ncbi:MAG: TetR/AcrR family transcriptional regulator [Candidatus Hydrogenedentes bacterium]|nr:TetR/AcrR family transcriptional regulator [Candidatus Hydrogenedentota bacterium]
MPRVALSPDKIQEFRTRVGEAGTALLSRKGAQAITMRAIASELGCSPTTPYRYVRDKDEIFSLVRAAAFSRFADALDAATLDRPVGLDRLRRIFQAYIDFALTDPDAYRLMFEMVPTDMECYPELGVQMERSFECNRREVRLAIDAGILSGDVDTVAHVVWITLHGVTSLHLTSLLTMGKDMDSLIEPILQSLVRGNS